MLDVSVQPFAIEFGRDFRLTFHRTLRVPDDGKLYPLPPGLGAFPVVRCEDSSILREILPELQAEVFLPMYQREALWLGFTAKIGTYYALKIGAGMVNAITGARFDLELRNEPQDYLICPEQLWLDGFKTDDGVIRQFTAMPLGAGYTVENALSGAEQIGGIQVAVFVGRAGAFPVQEPSALQSGPRPFASMRQMGLGAGGQMKQKIYPDPYGLGAWDTEQFGLAHIRILNSAQFAAITGEEPPPTPIDARTYTEHGLPWFELYDEEARDVPASALLGDVGTVAERDRELGLTDGSDATVDVKPDQIKILHPPTG